ncbi:MAG: hypothetical protein OXF27_00200 [Acidobacteria bacterium]|nr:hypothetical protein [Acidobacteriota bacterium]
MTNTGNRRSATLRLAAAGGLAALLAAPAASDPAIEATPRPDGGYELTLEVPEAIGVGEGQRLLLPTAVRLCDGLAPRLGAYRFETRERVDGPGSADSFVLVQEIRCGGAGPAPDRPPGRELGDPERAEIERTAGTPRRSRCSRAYRRGRPPTRTGAGSRPNSGRRRAGCAQWTCGT